MRVIVDKARAADLGVSWWRSYALETMMGGRRATTFVDNGEEYDVVLQAERSGRASTADLPQVLGVCSLMPLRTWSR
jgi:multidrug efflux pump